MQDLNVFKIYEATEKEELDEFAEKISSDVNITKELKKVELDTKWIDLMEETIPHIETALRNPNRFIVNEEEVVKIELARRITVDSIKHLSKHTNFIQSIDDETGEVTPSKILNINKEEDYDTYENRVLYTLIQNMMFYLNKKKKELEASKDFVNKNNKLLKYSGVTRVKNEDINININLETKEEQNTTQDEIEKRINKIDEDILMLRTQEVYKILDKKHVALVTPPVKKTNRILKNPDFQYAMKLWAFLQENNEDKPKVTDKNDVMDKNENLKRLMDETFLLGYLSLIDDEKTEEEKQKTVNKLSEKVRQQITEKLIEKIVFVNSEVPKDKLQEMIGEKYETIKVKEKVTTKGIEKIFKERLDRAIKIMEI